MAARDLIHVGWKLLGHPLYGNFRPHQQPYRSLLLKHDSAGLSAPDGLERFAPDEYSLHLIEEAINVYQSVPGLSPSQAPAVFLEDCALLDYELMRLPLEQAGWPKAGSRPGGPGQ